MAPPTPPPPPPPHSGRPMNFWDFIRGFEHSATPHAPGTGADYFPPPPPPQFMPGYHGAGPWWSSWNATSDQFNENNWVPFGSRRSCRNEPQSSGEENSAAAADTASASANANATATAQTEKEDVGKDAAGDGKEPNAGESHHHHDLPHRPRPHPHRPPPHPRHHYSHHHHPPRHGWHHRHPHHGRHGPGPEAWMNNLSEQLMEHFAPAMFAHLAENSNNNNNDSNDKDDVDAFAPPVDIFEVRDLSSSATNTAGNSTSAWVVHVAVAGARREDVGVAWDADAGVLTVSGVVHRPGDEAFQAGLVSGERRVGLFQRTVQLPPPAAGAATVAKEEVDGDGITARLEDGLLVVTVPRREREWTEVRKVDVL